MANYKNDMHTTRPIDLSAKHLALIKSVLHEHLLSTCPQAQVWLFGSRANGRSHPRSDIDLAIDCRDSSHLSYTTLDALRRGFADSALPQRVDIVDIARVSDSAFRENLRNEAVHLSLNP